MLSTMSTSSLLVGAAICLATISILVPTISCSSDQNSISQYQNRTRRSSSDSDCRPVLKSVEVTFPGCTPTTVEMDVCEGSCRTVDVISRPNEPPYRDYNCRCCQAVKYTIRKKRAFKVQCTTEQGVTKSMTKTFYLPKIKSCGCVECASGQS